MNFQAVARVFLNSFVADQSIFWAEHVLKEWLLHQCWSESKTSLDMATSECCRLSKNRERRDKFLPPSYVNTVSKTSTSTLIICELPNIQITWNRSVSISKVELIRFRLLLKIQIFEIWLQIFQDFRTLCALIFSGKSTERLEKTNYSLKTP